MKSKKKYEIIILVFALVLFSMVVFFAAQGNKEISSVIFMFFLITGQLAGIISNKGKRNNSVYIFTALIVIELAYAAYQFF